MKVETKKYIEGYKDGRERLYNKILETIYDCQFLSNSVNVVKADTIINVLKKEVKNES